MIHQRKISYFLLSTLFSILLGIVLSDCIKYVFHLNNGKPDPNELSVNDIIGNTFTAVFFIIIATGTRLILQYNIDRIKKAEMSAIIQRAELDALKAQMNPHFLFNAFNSIYALAETKSVHTAKAILQLSDITRYVTYKSSQNEVSVIEELQFIRSYIDFQKLRIANPENKIIIDITEPTTDFFMSPLLLLTFIENAFKHSNLLKVDAQIHVKFTATCFGFNYYVSNEIATNNANDSGIGLQTLKKVLEFNYPNAHTLKIWTENNIHYAELSLNSLRK
ncbi:MAG: two-component system LytT family sensor kinase [Crocinitomix sp.]